MTSFFYFQAKLIYGLRKVPAAIRLLNAALISSGYIQLSVVMLLQPVNNHIYTVVDHNRHKTTTDRKLCNRLVIDYKTRLNLNSNIKHHKPRPPSADWFILRHKYKHLSSSSLVITMEHLAETFAPYRTSSIKAL